MMGCHAGMMENDGERNDGDMRVTYEYGRSRVEDGTRAELNEDIEEGRLKARLKRQMGWGWLLNGLV